ncbi:hypothetical protein GCK72_025091 [Caenorhabditis remanei]|uniref:Uncharacterized protein n=1 Tax=Caenorhabditis remanei TaxID=31234 RepID=A0A6A5G1X7_CAERE|nr:hypothetical protein GCK72_025091 [Caenorhabditis remanei]KAF1748624.1 hypothetical protein GCK72_025091 [Caenorhabditis remanei]
MDWWLGFLKRVKPAGKKLLRKYVSDNNELLDLVINEETMTFTKCDLDATTLMNILNVVSSLMAAGKTSAAAEYCQTVADACFGQSIENPYRLMLLSFSMIADCEARFYDLNIFQPSPKDISLKIRYSRCQQASASILEVGTTLFKIGEILTMCEEFSHFACIRQCHVNLLRNFAEIDEDESVDWFDRVKVLDSSILALINESDIAARLCETDKEKKEFLQNLHKIQSLCVESNDQYCFSWFNQLHLREICVRSVAAVEVLKSDIAFKTFEKTQPIAFEKCTTVTKQSKNRRRLQPQNPELEVEEKAKRVSFGEDSGVLADANMIILRKNSKTLTRRQEKGANKKYSTDVEDLNYSTPLTDDGETFSNMHAAIVKEKAAERKDQMRKYNAGGAADCRKRLPEAARKKIRIVLRNMMAEGREIQQEEVKDDILLNKAFPVTDDECSDDESAPASFFRTETLETLRKKKMRKFGFLDPKSEAKHVLWWHNAKDELMTTRAISTHCLKMNGESSGPLGTFEHYLGKVDNGGNLRDRMSESNREANCRTFRIEKETDVDDGALLTMPAVDPFKESRVTPKRRAESVGLKSLLLQNMRRKVIDELLILMMIIKGQQQLQDGNETYHLNPIHENNFFTYLMHLYKHLLAKFRLYSTELFGLECLNEEQETMLAGEPEIFDLNNNCFEFCRDTGAYYFCICIRGRIVKFEPNDWGLQEQKLNRDDVEMQHEFFFGLDNSNKSSHLANFWRTECMPIVSGLIHMVNHSLVDKIDKMDAKDSAKILENIPGLSCQTRQWLKQVTRYGFVKEISSEEKRDTASKFIVPILFQLPSNVQHDLDTENLVTDLFDLDEIYRTTTHFVRQKYHRWKEACKADKEKFQKTNRDMEFYVEKDLTFFGEAIEKDVYMVAVYIGEKKAEERDTISTGMHQLCRSIRSQAGFMSIQSYHVAESSSE